MMVLSSFFAQYGTLFCHWYIKATIKLPLPTASSSVDDRKNENTDRRWRVCLWLNYSSASLFVPSGGVTLERWRAAEIASSPFARFRRPLWHLWHDRWVVCSFLQHLLIGMALCYTRNRAHYCFFAGCAFILLPCNSYTLLSWYELWCSTENVCKFTQGSLSILAFLLICFQLSRRITCLLCFHCCTCLTDQYCCCCHALIL